MKGGCANVRWKLEETCREERGEDYYQCQWGEQPKPKDHAIK